MFDLTQYLTDMEVSFAKDELLKTHSTMKIGGKCNHFITPKDIDQFILVVTICKMYNIEYFVIGNGSNIIFTDKGFNGAIICTKNIKGISIKNNILTVKCGTMVREVATFCLNEEMLGFENLSGIPATIGGAVFMNAGAYGSEIKDIIASAKVLDIEGNVYTINRKDMDLKYRHTNFMDNSLFVLEANFILKKSNFDKIKEIMDKNDSLRKEKQPIDKKSVGSTFKRPKGENLFAGKLIEDCGLKGFNVGGARVSDKHAGFVINDDNATFAELNELITHIKDTVKNEKSVELELEAIIVGEV